MRRKRQLAISGLLAALAAAPHACAAADAESAAVWLPEETGDLEAPDRLEERGPEAGPGAGARSDLREGRWKPKRVWAEAAWRPLGSVRAEWLALANGAAWGTLGIRRGPRAALVAGAIVVRRPPSLFGEALGLTRTLRAPRRPEPGFESGLPMLEGPRGASSPAVRGAATAAAAGPVAAWGLIGNDGDDRLLHAGGFAWRHGALAATVAAGAVRGARRAGSLSAGLGRTAGEDRLSCEVLLSRERGPELLAEAVRSAGPLAVEARWRRRPGEARPVAGELVARWGLGPMRARLSWRPWSARAPADDGRVELETTVRDAGRGPIRMRLGARAAEDALLSSSGSGGERYAIADVGIARERGRAFSVLVSVRDSRRAAGSAIASAFGGRLALSARGRAGAVLVMQARRAAARSGSEGDAPAAWTASLAPSGAETIAAHAGSGIAASGRAWVRMGGFRLEALVSDAAAPEGEGSSAGSLRIEWGRGDQ
ncbi:MAG TPA: hypothetical protein VE326_01270 [Candidatus Binatia bacterium]|nr:hypothetical protein [Candidatus Binatia bacterium]